VFQQGFESSTAVAAQPLLDGNPMPSQQGSRRLYRLSLLGLEQVQQLNPFFVGGSLLRCQEMLEVCGAFGDV
jgi:hypothetical protein